jgi:hypothetical protein
MIEKGYAENMKIKKYGLDSSGKGSSILPLKQRNKHKNKTWKPFGSCLLNSTANPAQFRYAEMGYLAGNSQTVPTIFFIFSAYIF